MIDETDDLIETDDGDEEEIPPTPRKRSAAAEAGRAAKGERDVEKKKKELITLGKSKGFLTYEEVNDHMPESIVSSDQIDDWLSALGGEGIEIVDSDSKVKVADAAPPDEEESDTAERDEREEEEEDDEAYAKSNDPVRMYLRKMGSVALLTREGEVEIAKRIEDGERRVLQVVLNSPVAIREIIDLAEKLRKQKIRVKEVVKDGDDESEDFDEQLHIDRVCKVIEKVKRHQREIEKLHEKTDPKTATDQAKKKLRLQVDKHKQEMFEVLHDLRLHKRQIDRIVNVLKSYVVRIDNANREIGDCERRSGLGIRELRKTLRELRTSDVRRRAVAKKLGLRPEELEEMAKVIANAQKKVKIVV